MRGKTKVNKSDTEESFGMLFYADIYSFEEILITDSVVENWTYPLIQPKLLEEAKNKGFIN